MLANNTIPPSRTRLRISWIFNWEWAIGVFRKIEDLLVVDRRSSPGREGWRGCCLMTDYYSERALSKRRKKISG
jgi:hypothetical protein